MPEPRPRVNSLSLAKLCWLFCCLPSQSRIAPKLAFLSPEPTYIVMAPEQGAQEPAPSTLPGQASAMQPAPAELGAGPGACSRHLSEPANWKYSQRELDPIEVFFWSKGWRRPLQPLHAAFLTG